MKNWEYNLDIEVKLYILICFVNCACHYFSRPATVALELECSPCDWEARVWPLAKSWQWFTVQINLLSYLVRHSTLIIKGRTGMPHFRIMWQGMIHERGGCPEPLIHERGGCPRPVLWQERKRTYHISYFEIFSYHLDLNVQALKSLIHNIHTYGISSSIL